MGEPLRAAVRLLAELPQLTQFLARIPDAEMPSHGVGQVSGLELPTGCPDFWQAAADDVLKELRSEPASDEVETKKARLRRLLQRAHHSRKCQLPKKGGCSSALLAVARGTVQDLPLGVTNAMPGLFVADVPEACENGLAPPASLARHLGVEDVQCFGDFASDQQRQDFWGVYRLFEERLVLLFDQGRSMLAVGSPAVLTCLLYGVLLRCWELRAEDALEYLKHLGRDVSVLPQSFGSRCAEAPAYRPSLTRDRPSVLRALWQHVRLLEESQRWPLPRTEPLTRATEALLARALGWEPRRHDSLSVGATCLAVLRSIHTELSSLPDKGYSSSWNDLVCIRRRIGGATASEDGLALEVSDAEKAEPAKLREEVVAALEDASKPPQLLLLALDGQRPVCIEETIQQLSLQLGSSASYSVFALGVGSTFVTRVAGSALQLIPGASSQDGMLIVQPPLTVVLTQASASQTQTWTPWSHVLSSCAVAKKSTAIVEVRSTFHLRLVTVSQYDSAKRSARFSAWEEADAVGEVLELPRDAKISSVHQKLATKLQIPVSLQLILMPVEQRGDQSWQILLPSARIIDHAVPVDDHDGPLVLVLSVQRDAGHWLQRNPNLKQPATHFLSFPWMPVLCIAWVERQPLLLDSMLLDARCSLASYAGRVARRIEEELGPRAYSTAFAVYELAAGANPGCRASWRPLKLGAIIATELQQQGEQHAGHVQPLTQLLWEVLPLAPSMTGRGWFAAQDAACLPDPNSTKKLFPLERLATRKADQQEAGLVLLCQQLQSLEAPYSSLSNDSLSSDAEEYAALLILEERLLVAWVEDFTEATEEVTVEARRRIDAMAARLAMLAPEEAPPGLKEWPAEPIPQWTCRVWEKICRGASSLQVWATPGPDATEDEVMRSLLWAEVATLQEIVLSLDAIRFGRQGRVTLGSATARERLGQVSHIGATVSDVVEAERSFFSALLKGTDLDELFACEIEDLPSECDTDVGSLHAFIQTTNAELNSLWLQQRQTILEKSEGIDGVRQAQLWRIVRLRELALSALFLLVKQTQATKVLDGAFLEWLQEVQEGCRTIIYKSKILCEAASALAGLPGGGETAIVESIETLALQLSAASVSLDSLGVPSGEAEADAAELKKAEEHLATCDTDTLFGNLALLALERQLEASVAPPSRRLVAAMRGVRLGLHRLTLQTMLVRARFDLPLDDASTTFTLDCQRRGRKMRLLGRSPRRAAALAQAPFNPTAPSPDEIAADEAAAVQAEAQAEAFLQAEAKAQNKKEKQKTAKKSKQKNAKKSAAGTKGATNVEDVIASPCLPDEEITPIPSRCDEWVDAKTCEDAADHKDEGKSIASLIDGQPGAGAPVAAVSEPEEEAAPDGGYCTPLEELDSGEGSEAKHVFQSPLAEVSLVKSRLEVSSVKLELEVRSDIRWAEEEVTQDLLYDEEDILEDLDSGFHIIKSGKAKKKMKQLPVEEIIEVVPSVEKKQSPEKEGRTRRRGKKEKVQEAQETQSPARRKQRNPESREEATPEDHVEEQLVIDRDTCDFLCERRKLRLIEIERTSKAQCTLDKAALLLRLSGKSLAVVAARRLVHDLAVQWLQVVDAVWRMLLQTKSSHLNRLQEECECSVDVDRAEPWVKISGTTQQVEWARGWLRQMGDKCESVKVRLPSHVKWVEALAKRAEGSGTGVTVALTRERGGFTAHVVGFAAEVKRAVEMLNAEVFKSPPPADARTHWIEVSDSVWRLLLKGCHSGSHLSRLQEECECSITVDRSSAWIMVNGSENQAEKAQTMLFQFIEECDTPQARPPGNFQARPPSPAKAADADAKAAPRSGEGASGRARAVFRKEGSSGLNPVEALIRSVNPVEALLRSAEGCSGRDERTQNGARATFKQDHSSGLNPVEAMFKMAEASNGTHKSGAPGTHVDAKHMVEALFAPIAESQLHSSGGSQSAQSRYLSSPDDLVAEYEERTGARTPSSSSSPRDLPHISMATPAASPICGNPYSSTSTTSTTPTSPPNNGIPISPCTVDSDYTNGSDYIGYSGYAGPTPMPFIPASNSQAMPMQGPGGNCFFVPVPMNSSGMPVMNPAMMAAPMPMHPVMMGGGTYGYEGVLDGRGVQLPPSPTQQTVFGDTAIVTSQHNSSNARRKIPNKPVLKNAAASTQNTVQQPPQATPKSQAKREDDDAKKLASRLAQQFPGARIQVGAPDCQEPPAPPRKQEKAKEAPDTMEGKMRKLQDLLQKGR